MQSNPYQSLVSLLSNILEAYTTALFVVDRNKRTLELVAVQSLSKHLPDRISLPIEQSGILSQVHKVGQTIHLDKLPEASPNLASTVPFYREGESHIKGLLAIPVGDGVGVLYVDTKYGWGFNDKQQKWIREVASVLNELIQRQECFVQQQNYAHILDLWHRIDQATLNEPSFEDYCRLVVEESSRFLETDFGFLAVREPNNESYRLLAATQNVPRNLTSQRLLVKQGLIGWVFQNQKNLYVSKLNPQASDHFILTPSEALPHHGTFWAMPVQICLGHSVVVGFLSRNPVEWNADDQFAISHMLHFFRMLMEQLYFREECEHLQANDLATGLCNGLAFEARMEAVLATSMQNSTPVTLALCQLEPWQVLSTKTPPKQVRQWQADLASSLRDAVPAGVLAGQLAENRYGLLFPGMTPQEADLHLSNLIDPAQSGFAGKLKTSRLQPFVCSVGFPQDATRSDELWPLAYRRLFAAFRSKSEQGRA